MTGTVINITMLDLSGLRMSYSARWKILEGMIVEFRKKGLEVSQTILNDLKSAKVLITIMSADEKDRGETAPKIDEHLGSVEAYLVTEAQKAFPPAKVDEWLRRLDEASCEICATEAKKETTFVSGLPRDQKWIRVKPLTSLPTEKLKRLAEETSLSFREEEDGHLIVYGSAEEIKEFIKRMTEETNK